jgi:hypothetical protein
MSTHALVEKAMVANLSIGVWAGHRLDKEASRKITEQSGAHADAARVNKHLVPKEMLAPVISAANAVRSHFYDNSLPWRDNGDRLLTRDLYMKFIQTHEAMVTEFDRVVENFLADKYPEAIEKAQFRMGEMFKRDDYPPVSELRRRFYIALDFDAVTTSNDFRVQIDQDHVDKVKASMEQAAERRINAAMQDVWKRLAETIGRFQTNLAEPGKVFRDTTVNNVAELIDLIPGLNVLDNPEIEEIRQNIKAKLVGADAKSIRDDPALRQELAGDAKQIMDKMSGFAKAFGYEFTT